MEEIVTRSAVCFGNGLCSGSELIASGPSSSLLTVPQTFEMFRHAEGCVLYAFRSDLGLVRFACCLDGLGLL